MSELNAQQRKLRDRAREVAEASIAPRAAEVDRSEEYPWDNVRALTEAGFMGMTIPPEFGGPGLSYMDAVLVVEEMARVCGVTGRIVVEGNMGAIGAIMAYGSDAQKRLAAELVLAGDKPAICITEPEAGSAATEMTTRADRRGVEQGIGGFIAVRGESEGLVVGRREPAMGLRGIPETEMHFEDLELPADRLIEPPRGLARGFAGLMNAYNAQRVGAATVALGIAQGAYELALDYSQRREQFGRPICEFQGLQWMLVDMNIQLEAARALVHKAARGGDGGFPDIGDAARAKILASESAIRVTNDALQVFGAAGYSRNLPLERMARDARMFTIGGGTAQILRTVVASRILARKLPQTRDGYLETDTGEADRRAARG